MLTWAMLWSLGIRLAAPANPPRTDRVNGRQRFNGSFQHQLRQLLAGVSEGTVGVDIALRRLGSLPFSDLGFARVDHHRELRQGACEIVYGPGKTDREVAAIVGRLFEVNSGPILVTRATARQRAHVRRLAERLKVHVVEKPRARAIAIWRNVPAAAGAVFIVTGGTSDLPVAEEAELTAHALGAAVELGVDAGVAGLHRIAAERQRLEAADVVVVIAGMEGALASVVGGLVSCPVIACPTSVGYGASFGGLAALLAMLSSCTPGIACVNIDDGVGAGYLAALIARAAHRG